jgi:ankyrin repeat protein
MQSMAIIEYLDETDSWAAKKRRKGMNEQLIAAAERGDTAAVLAMISAGADINAQDGRGCTPVMAATHGNHADTVRTLIQAGADINLRDDRKDNVLLYAGAEGLLDILQLAIAARADTRITNRFGGTALIPAAERGHVEVVRELLTHSDVDVNHVNNLGWTALLEAIVLSDGGPRHQEIVHLLIAHGANVNLPDKDGKTPLQLARQRGFAPIERMLAQAGAS